MSQNWKILSKTMGSSVQANILRTSFLQNAANSVAMTSPSTASYLASESIQQQLAHGPPDMAFANQQRQMFCTACGNVFIPAWNSSITRGIKASPVSALKDVRRRSVIYQCRVCYRRTTFDLHPPKRLDTESQDDRYTGRSTMDLGTKHESNRAPPVPRPKPSSKKRAKARRDKERLQSTVKQRAEDRSEPLELSLMDLMMP